MTSFSNIKTGICTSSSLAEISIATDSEFLDVRIGDGSLFEERLYPSDGVVKIFGINKIIENYLLRYGLAFKPFAIVAATPDSEQIHVDLDVIYCDRQLICTDLWEFFQRNFLSASDFRRLHRGQDITLHFFNTTRMAVPVIVDFVAIDPIQGVLKSQAQLSADIYDKGVHSIPVKYTDIMQHVRKLSADAFLIDFTVSAGERSFDCYIDSSLSEDSEFTFVNSFGLQESVSLHIYTTAKTTREVSSASVCGITRQYDAKVTQLYEVEAGPLSKEEAEFAGQLLSSRKISHKGREIIITDLTSEIPDAPEKMYTVKFSWRYAPDTPLIEK